MKVRDHLARKIGAGFACFRTLRNCAFPHFTLRTVTDLYAVGRMTTVAVDHVGSECKIVSFCPFFSGFTSKGIIVCFRCDVCVALGAVKSADCNNFFHNNPPDFEKEISDSVWFGNLIVYKISIAQYA